MSGRATDEEKGRRLRLVLTGIGVVALLVVAGLGLKSLLADGGKPKKASVQTIAVLRPPPPPPPPKPEEKPPEVKKEEVKLPEPEPVPKAESEPPPGPDLGVDAEGGAGSDNFGLVGKPGGRDITELGEVNASGAGDRYAGFKAALGVHFQDVLMRNERLRNANYRALLSVWLSPSGRVERVEIAKGSGDEAVDALIRATLAQAAALQPTMPQDLPQPVRLTVTSRGAG